MNPHTHTCVCWLFAAADGTVPYEGPGVELAFPHLDQTDPLLVLQLQHRYTAVCLALKHTLRYNTQSHVKLSKKCSSSHVFSNEGRFGFQMWRTRTFIETK